MATLQLSLIIASTLHSLSCGKIYELFHRDHYHDTMQDLPVGSRYASVIAFYNETSQCQRSLKYLPFSATGLPSIQHLFLGQYELSTSRDRIWYVYEQHMDLAQYVGINDYMLSKQECECPILAFIPSSYADQVTDNYLANPSTDGIKIWDSESETDWKLWTWRNLLKTVRIVMDLPFDFEITVKHQTTNTYLQKQGKPYTQTIAINSILSHRDLTVFPGDTIYISQNPEPTQQSKNTHNKLANPIYTIHANMWKLHVVHFDDNSWGFHGKRPPDISARWLAQRHSTTLMTHTRNLVMPPILPAIHSKGFVKMQMPTGLHERLVGFYRKWYHLRQFEEWDRKDTQINYYKVKTHVVALYHDPPERDGIAQNVMKQVLLQWVRDNGATSMDDLKYTSFYGIREYSRGASLRNHVDRVETHVLSAILQIAQSGVDRPWPLQVIGFDGKMYDVTMEVGEMILYEGHKLVHGRPYPFNGTTFANAFVHFRPMDWNWSNSKIWKTPQAIKMLQKMHIDTRTGYR